MCISNNNKYNTAIVIYMLKAVYIGIMGSIISGAILVVADLLFSIFNKLEWVRHVSRCCTG